MWSSSMRWVMVRQAGDKHAVLLRMRPKQTLNSFVIRQFFIPNVRVCFYVSLQPWISADLMWARVKKCLSRVRHKSIQERLGSLKDYSQFFAKNFVNPFSWCVFVCVGMIFVVLWACFCLMCLNVLLPECLSCFFFHHVTPLPSGSPFFSLSYVTLMWSLLLPESRLCSLGVLVCSSSSYLALSGSVPEPRSLPTVRARPAPEQQLALKGEEGECVDPLVSGICLSVCASVPNKQV